MRVESTQQEDTPAQYSANKGNGLCSTAYWTANTKLSRETVQFKCLYLLDQQLGC